MNNHQSSATKSKRKGLRGLLLLAVLATVWAATVSSPPVQAGQVGDTSIRLEEFVLNEATENRLNTLWLDQLQTRRATNGWVPMRADLTDEMLDLLGLPPRALLSKMRFPRPTIVDRLGRTREIRMGPGGAGGTYAGAGWFGIRPGAWLLINGQVPAWCSMAHVYGKRGSYDISTAGHCAPTGATATVVAAFANSSGISGPVLLDFGTFATSVDQGPGRDWALIDIHAQHQRLVTPTMAFWGGPRGMFTKNGAAATLHPPGVTPDPLLAQAVVHYGHGTGVGAGGTPRAGGIVHWDVREFTVFGAFSFGDSGSGVNTLGGDTIGATMQAAGIFTHLRLPWLDLFSRGLGTMAGTRATQIPAQLADGQLVSYPVPQDGAP